MRVKLVSVTKALPKFGESLGKSAEQIIAYCARVSSQNQSNPSYEKLFRYLIEHKHWSPFEMADMTVEIETSRAIAPQILRHRSFQFQEFSQRFSKVQHFETVELRMQGDTKQGSAEIIDDDALKHLAHQVILFASTVYDELIEQGVSRECARGVLPLCTQTKIYMKGSVRSWIHYLQVRCASDTQKEHRLIAEEIRKIFIEQFPITSKALGWSHEIT